MANTEAESVDDMVDASKREVINGRWMLVQLMPDSYQEIEVMMDLEAEQIVPLGELTPKWWI